MTSVQVLLAVVTSFVVLAAGFFRLAMTVGRLRLQVETLWDFLLGRAKVEFLKVGWGAQHSPTQITTAGFDAVMPFLDVFLPAYVKMVAKGLSEREMFIEMERQFSGFIIEKICIPHGVSAGACIIDVLEACKTESARQTSPQ